MTTPTTFAFSDEELLDALTTIDNEPVDFGAFDRVALASAESLEASFTSDPFAVTNSSFVLDTATAAPTAQLHARSMDKEDADSTDSSSEHSSPVECETSPTENCETKPKRKRTKHELDAVRSLATSLESQLASLRKRHHPEQPGANFFWKRVADQLLLDRQRAMAENGRLKEIFQDQTKVLQAIHKSIQKIPDLEKLGVVPSPSRPLDTRSSNEIYSRLFNDVANAYSGTDSVLDRAGVRQANESKRKVNMTMTTDDGQSAMSLEVAESRIIPFHVAQVTASTWGLLSKSTCATDMDVAFKKVVQARGDDVFGVCRIGRSLGLYTLNGDMAMRRFVEGDRMTYVWECVGRCDNDTDPSSSFRIHEKGWVVFEPSPVDPLHKSIFRTCVQFAPQPLEPSQELSTAAKDIGLATEIALSVYESTIGSIYTCVIAELMGEISLE